MVASLYVAEAGLLAGLELVVRLVLVLVHILQEVRSQGRREWMRKIGVDHNTNSNPRSLYVDFLVAVLIHSVLQIPREGIIVSHPKDYVLC